jgi:hypothetical protein
MWETYDNPGPLDLDTAIKASQLFEAASVDDCDAIWDQAFDLVGEWVYRCARDTGCYSPEQLVAFSQGVG